jgi:DNA-binding CsgD family transcriptional regulator
MKVDQFVKARDAMLAVDRAGRSVEDVLAELLHALHTVTQFDRSVLLLTDNDTMLPFGGIVEAWGEHDCVPFYDNELLDPDFAKFNVLARSSDPVAILSELTDGDLTRSPRYQKLFAPNGGGDELRAAFVTGGTCWAVVSLVRPLALGLFPPAEIAAVRELIPIASRALRSAIVRRDTQQVDGALGMLVVGADGTIETATPDADVLLRELMMPGFDGQPASVLSAARRAKATRGESRVTLRARGSSGQWFRIHASRLGDDGRVAVLIEPARPADLVPILLESYGLTQRESELVPLLARGLSTKEIAAELCISRHTVNDHMKLIFSKCGVSSRGELVAKLFSEHIIVGHKAATAHH